MSCHFDDYIPTQYYLVTPDVETDDEHDEHDEHDELRRIVREQLGHDKFTSMYCDVICIARCPQCSSEDIFQDF